MFFLTPTQASNFLPKAYNSFAEDFSQTRKNSWTEFEDLLDDNPEVKIFSPLEEKKTIVDMGCGNGRLYNFLAEKNYSGEYIGIDVAQNFLDIAEKNISSSLSSSRNFLKSDSESKNVRDLISQETNTKSSSKNKLSPSFKKGSFLNIPLEKNSVDEFWAIASFHHLATHSERKESLEKIFDTLKPDGKIFLTVWNLWEQKKYLPQKNQAKFRSMCNPFFSERDFLIPWGNKKTPRYYYSFSEKYLQELLEESGFEIEKIFYSDKKRNLCVRARKIQLPPSPPLRGGEKVPLLEGDLGGVFHRFHIKNIPFQKISFEESLEKIITWAQTEKNFLKKIYTPNPEMIVECETNKKFEKILQNADLSLADGNGILWASGIKNLQGKFFVWKWILGIFSLFHYAFFRKNFPKEISEPICGSDIFREFLERTKNCKGDDLSRPKIFLLGGEPGSAKILQEKFPQVVGYFDGIANEKNLPAVFAEIKKLQANAIFVALGAPKQEKIIDQMAKEKISSGIAMGVGGSFDFMTGHQTRAPKIFRTLGIEWIYRLVKQPERAGRIWNATGKFIGVMVGK